MYTAARFDLCRFLPSHLNPCLVSEDSHFNLPSQGWNSTVHALSEEMGRDGGGGEREGGGEDLWHSTKATTSPQKVTLD